MKWDVPADMAGERADRVLAIVSGAARSACRRALETGDVLVDGARSRPRDRVAAGSVMTGSIPDRRSPLEAEPVEFGVAYEDEHLAVIDKPAGVVTHPGAGIATGTLAGGILHRWPGVRGVGTEDRWGIVHRLDRDTSGLLVVALSAQAYTGLTEALQRREIRREYVCLVCGVPPAETGTIEAPIGRDPRRPTRMAVNRAGREAVTHYQVDEYWNDAALLRVTLETGRTHQIRVHLASIGLPVAGDGVYGRPAASPRLFLHSARLGFEHPITGKTVECSSPLPADLASVVAGLG